MMAITASARADFFFNSGSPNGLMAIASRPDNGAGNEIEAADDFLLSSETLINHATFTGLLPTGLSLASVQRVDVAIYRVFALDSNTTRTPLVPTRANSPSDVETLTRSSADASLTFASSLISASFTANNSILNGIHPAPNETTGGEGAVTGEEVTFDITFNTPLDLPADHYFFVPQVQLNSGNFYWLSAPRPIVSPGTNFSPDLQAWVRNAALEPDWLRAGADIVGGATPPTFNESFTLSGTTVPEPGSLALLAAGILVAGVRRRAR
jgi:hypothetical protein